VFSPGSAKTKKLKSRGSISSFYHWFFCSLFPKSKPLTPQSHKHSTLSILHVLNLFTFFQTPFSSENKPVPLFTFQNSKPFRDEQKRGVRVFIICYGSALQYPAPSSASRASITSILFYSLSASKLGLIGLGVILLPISNRVNRGKCTLIAWRMEGGGPWRNA